jgi:hypothetical protein
VVATEGVAAELAMRSSAERLDARAAASMMANSPRGPVPVAIMAADARQPISQLFNQVAWGCGG